MNSEKLRRSIIHGDYHTPNLIIEAGKIKAVIDWDDTSEDYLVSEVATALNHFFLVYPKADKKYMPLFFEEYEKVFKLTAEEKKAIYYFIKRRMLGVIIWCDKVRKEDKGKYRVLTRWLEEALRAYREFDKVSLEDFLKMLEIKN